MNLKDGAYYWIKWKSKFAVIAIYQLINNSFYICGDDMPYSANFVEVIKEVFYD